MRVATPFGGRTRLEGVRVHVRPVEAESARVTLPLNPPRPVTEIVEDPVEPTVSETVVGLAATVKSLTENDSHGLVAGKLLASPLYIALNE
jgi:hypothetical protein